MIARRLSAAAIVAALASSLAGCPAGTGQLAQTPGAKSHLFTYQYTALGASDAVGYGSSFPCATAAVVVGPDTVQMPSPANCIGGFGYVPRIGATLAAGGNVVLLTDLGISGADIGPDYRSVGNFYEPLVFGCAPSGPNACVPGDLISDEVPLLPSPANTVTIFTGGNDVNTLFAGAVVIAGGGGNPGPFIQGEFQAFANDYIQLLGTVHKLFPFAHIYIANLPNFGLIPRGVCLGATSPSPTCPTPGNNPAGQALLDTLSTQMDALIINQFAGNGIPVLDLECDPRSYDPNNFYVDGFHPNDSGYGILAQQFVKAISAYGAPPPSGSCGQFSAAGVRMDWKQIGKLAKQHLKYLKY